MLVLASSIICTFSPQSEGADAKLSKDEIQATVNESNLEADVEHQSMLRNLFSVSTLSHVSYLISYLYKVAWQRLH